MSTKLALPKGFLQISLAEFQQDLKLFPVDRVRTVGSSVFYYLKRGASPDKEDVLVSATASVGDSDDAEVFFFKADPNSSALSSVWTNWPFVAKQKGEKVSAAAALDPQARFLSRTHSRIQIGSKRS